MAGRIDREIVNRLYEGTQYQADFVKRADEATRLNQRDRKADDRELGGDRRQSIFR